MATMYENIQDLCSRRGMTPSGLCMKIGLSKSIMTDIRNNPERKLSVDNISKIAQFLGVTTDEIIFGKKENPTENIREVKDEDLQAAGYYDLTKANQVKVEEYIALLLTAQSKE